MERRVAIVGAGIAGLACARELASCDQNVLVLERSRGVGGRCATRRVEGQAVDHGLSFLHGARADLRGELEAVPDATPLWGWPTRVAGDGTPCSPEAFRPAEWRVAFAEGLNVFAKYLAAGLDVRRGVRIGRLEAAGATLVASAAERSDVVAHDVVLALPAPQSQALLRPLLASSPEVAAASALLGMLGSHPSITILAGYSPTTPDPGFDVAYPAETTALHLVAHDSAKRIAPRARVLVLQARPCWSAQSLDAPDDICAATLLAEVAELVGDWAREPVWWQVHRWRAARADRGMELCGPMLVELPGGARLGLCGEVFGPGAGFEAAYVSGRRLARRLLGENE